MSHVVCPDKPVRICDTETKSINEINFMDKVMYDGSLNGTAIDYYLEDLEEYLFNDCPEFYCFDVYRDVDGKVIGLNHLKSLIANSPIEVRKYTNDLYYFNTVSKEDAAYYYYLMQLGQKYGIEENKNMCKKRIPHSYR